MSRAFIKTVRQPGIIRAAALALLLIPSVSWSQGDQDPGMNIEEIPPKSAPVIVDGKALFFVHGIATFSPEQRADGISQRIRSVAADRSISDTSLKLVPATGRIMIVAGTEFIMGIHDIDSARLGVRKAVLAEFYEVRIKNAISSYRMDRSRPVLLKKLVHAIVVTVISVLVAFILVWLIRKIRTWLENRIRSKVEGLEDRSFRLIRSSQLWMGFRILFRTIRIVLIVLIVAAYLQYILGLFPWTQDVAAYIVSIILDPLRDLGMGFLRFLPDLAFLVVIWMVTRYLLKLVRLFFNGIRDGGIKLTGFDPDWSLPTYKILRLVVIIFAFVIAYPYIPGSDTDAFKGISVFVGILFSLGSSSFISNIIAGYSMTYRGAFKKGDRIKVDETTGIVEEQKLLVTRLRSPKNEEIVIPNSELLNSNIINYSTRARDLGLIIHTMVGIGYETPWRLVDAMLKDAADRTEGLLKEPAPFVLKQSLGDFAVNYEINAFCNDTTNIPQLYNALHQNILDVFNENNVQIMTPAYEGDPEIPKVVPKDQWNMPLQKK